MQTKVITCFCLSSIASVLAVIPVNPAWAQTDQTAKGDVQTAKDAQRAKGDSTGNDDIIVTARKKNEALLDVPETVTAFSGPTLSKAGIVNVDSLGRQLPNVVLNRRGDNEPNVVIRGVGSFGNTQGVGFYIDDVRNVTDQSARLVDLERVEVLKGPQGTLYGGSSIGGAIKFVTKKPTYETEGQITVEGGQRNILNVSGSVNVPIVADKVALRVSAYSAHDDGYIYNPYLDENPDASTEYGFRAALRINPDELTEVLASLRYSKTENGGNDYYATSGPQDYSYQSALSERIYNHKEILGGTLSITRDLDFATLTSLTSYTARQNRLLWDVDITSADDVAIGQKKPVVTKVFTQELRLASNGSGPFSWLLGAYYSSIKDIDLLSHIDVWFGTPAVGEPLVSNYYDTRSMQRQYAGFANVAYTSGGFEINLGARLDHSKFSATDRNLGRSNEVSDTIVLPKFSLAYHASSRLLLYTSVSKGYEPSKLNLHEDSSLVPYKRETSLNFELGAKGQILNGLLDYELAGFYIKYKDRQFESRINQNGIVVEVITNIGTSDSYGVEFSGTLRPAKGLSISASGGFLQSTWLKGVYFLQDISGNRTTNAPRFSANVSADYSRPISANLKVGLRGELTHSSGFYWDVPNLTAQQAYDLAAFRISVADISDKWELALRVDNAFNTIYNSEYQDQILGDRINGVCNLCSDARIGAPRTIKASFTYKF